jgi:lysophospholipase L1-like esterase
MKQGLLLLSVLAFLGCAPAPSVDLLVPPEGRIGDIVALRDSAFDSFGTTEGSVFFDGVEATNIIKWTPSDIYVEVPPGISGTVLVTMQVGNRAGGWKNFTVREEAFSPRIMSFGDSFTYWGSQWFRMKIEEDPYMGQFDFLHLNHGRRGEKVSDSGTLVRWRDALAYSDSDFAVLMHGVNDLSDVLIPEYEIPLEEIRQGMIDLIDEAASTSTTLILCTLPPRVDSCGDVVSPTTEEYNDWLRSYAGQQGIPLVEVYDDFIATPNWGPLYFEGLCLHPAPGGYQRIGELVAQKIVELYLPTCTDLDTDGYGAPAAPPCPHPEPDCDDSDADIHPGVSESPSGDPVCSDGLDNDCDGFVDLEDSGCQE